MTHTKGTVAHMIVLVIVILLGLQAILWGAVVMGRLINKRHSTGEMRWRPRFYLLLDHLAHVKSTPPRLSVKDRKEALFLARELCRYMHEQSDPHHLATVYKLADHLLSPHLIKELQARQWSRKINVLYYMEDLRLKRLASQVWTMLNAFQRDELLTEQALRVLAQIQDHNVINVLRQCTDYPAFFYIDVLRRFERLSEAEASCLWHSHEKLKRASVLWLLDRDHPLGRRLIKAALHVVDVPRTNFSFSALDAGHVFWVVIRICIDLKAFCKFSLSIKGFKLSNSGLSKTYNFNFLQGIEIV